MNSKKMKDSEWNRKWGAQMVYIAEEFNGGA